MTDPTRPTDVELEAGHARLLALDKTLSITHYKVPYVMTAEEVEQARAAQATVAKWNWPELKAYCEGIRSLCKEPVRTARQRPREPRFMGCTLPPPDPSLQGVMDIAVQAQAAGIEWQGRTLVDVAADLEDKEPTT